LLKLISERIKRFFCDLKFRVLGLRPMFRAFRLSSRGNVAMIFALTLVPLALAAGAGMDMARALVVRSRLAEALDAAGLAVGAQKGLSQSQIQSLAQNYFNANFKLASSFGTAAPIEVTTSNGKATLSSSVSMPTVLMRLAGIKNLTVGFTSTIVWGQTKLWVALVLDNTGSMDETDKTGTSKMSALQDAAHQLLKMLRNASAHTGDVKVSIVPFNRDVNVGSGNNGEGWLDWTAWNAANTTTTTTCSGGGSGRHGGSRRHCTTTTVTANHNTWNGCIMDRDRDYDTENASPTGADWSSYFPTDQYSDCPAQIEPLTDDWSQMSDEIDAMYAAGNTNQTIGMVWGWQTLTDGDPMNAGALPSGTQKVIILLSDGLNTENRWTSNSSSIDAREERACANAKAAGVTIYTVFVDLNGTSGNSAPLQKCASSSSKYYDLTTAGAIVTAFTSIGTQITQLRVSG
jgi:Flp pilus assembly protein TadG